MNKQLETAYQRLLETKHRFINRITEKNKEQQSFNASETAWNMIEIMDHILVSETRILQVLKKNPPSETKYKVKLKDKIAYKLLAQFYKSPGKVKMPIKGLEPLGMTLEALIQQSNENDLFLKTLLENFPESKIKYSVFKHPVSGAMTMENTIDFFTNHFLHHFHQLNRIEKHAHYPKG